MEFCKTGTHNLVVVSWKLSDTARVARQFMCSHCFKLLDFDAVVEMNKKVSPQKED